MSEDPSAPAQKPLVLITGATGSIGSALVRRLSDRYRVVGLDRSTDEDDGIESYQADLTEDASVELALREIAERYGRTIASVIHLAAYFDFTGEESPLYESVNVQGTRCLLEHLAPFEVEQFVYSGTMLVHAPAQPGGLVDEETPLAPAWAYPKSKARAEQQIREARGDTPAVLLRLAGLYDEKTCVPTLSHQIARIYQRGPKSHLYSGDQSAGQAMIHMDDMLDLFERVVDRRAALAAESDELPIIAGEPETMSYSLLQDEIGRLIHGERRWLTLGVPRGLAKFGAKLETRSEPVIPDAFDRGQKPFIRPFMIDMASDHYALDISRARRLLDWEPQHRLADELPRIVDSLKSDPLGWYQANGILPPPWLKAAAERVDDPDALRARHEAEVREQHRNGLWAHWVNAGLAIWLITSPPLLGYDDPWMIASDLIAGVLLLIFALLSMSWRLSPARWVTAAIGVWIMFAPLLFWSDNGAAFVNGILVGLIVTGLAAGVRPPPGVSPVAAQTGPTIPKGWSYSPSTWLQRLPVILLAIVGLLISRYLGAYQLETIPGIWDPVFGSPEPGLNGSEAVVTSDVSEAWPVPDAGLGALVYALEIVVGAIGSARRWRTMPWLVVLFGILIVPLGAVSIFFIIIQPIVIGTYCTLCLVAAAAMLMQIPYSLDELVATYQFLRRRRAAGQPWLRVFFTGDTDEGEDERPRPALTGGARHVAREMLTSGMTPSWSLLALCGLGVLLMLAPLVTTWEDPMAATFHVVGALAVTATVTAMAPVARLLRFINALFGVVLIFAPFMVETGMGSFVFSIVCGIAMIGLSVPRGPVDESFGDWDRFVR